MYDRDVRCSPNCFQQTKFCSFLLCSDLRAKLEVSIDKVVELVKKHEHSPTLESDYASDSEDVSATRLIYETISRTSYVGSENRICVFRVLFVLQSPVIQCNMELTTAVRKELAMALRDLLQHGLIEVIDPCQATCFDPGKMVVFARERNKNHFLFAGWTKQQHCSFWLFPDPICQKEAARGEPCQNDARLGHFHQILRHEGIHLPLQAQRYSVTRCQGMYRILQISVESKLLCSCV